MDKIELLAPAKDLETGVAAINCGADAVYIGAARFGAREAAGNPLEALEQLVAHAHRYWARVYVTVNTLMRDDELPEAVRLIRQLYAAGVDALIIQDVGLLECDLPPIPLIASTQMHNHTPARVAFLEKVGFQRAILARELSLEQIRAIRAQTALELEVFVHGALCVSYSGQCYLSYALGGRSGNRGQCAQPCRRRYSLVDADGQTLVSDRHLLSLRDLNLSADLKDLLAAGVSSFKIEGRLKDTHYVMNVVSYYRQQLDAVLAGQGLKKNSSGQSQVNFTPDPAKTFNRGYTTYFLRGRGAPVASVETPKHVGEPVGNVVALGGHSFKLQGAAPLHNGDGLSFFNRKRELMGTVVNSAEGQTIVPDKMAGIEAGTLIYRNRDQAFETQLSRRQPERRIAVTFKLSETPDGFRLTATDEDGVQADFELAGPKVPADKPEQARATVHKQLGKVGGTGFNGAGVEVDLSEAYFLPLSTLNALRRGALEQLLRLRAERRPVRPGGAVKNDFPFPETALSYLGNVLNQKAAAFYRRHGVTQIAPAAESGMDLHGHKVMTTKYCLKYQLGLCTRHAPGETPVAPVAGDYKEPLYLVDEEGRRLRLRFQCSACEMEVFLEAKA
jgi:23S rRNA 5-hydroxycytidine C2501 synthase